MARGLPLAIAACALPAPLVARLVGVAHPSGSGSRSRGSAGRPSEAAAGWIVVDPNGIARHRSSGDARLVFWAERFGLVVLSNESKTRGLLAITTPEQTRYLPVRVADESDAAIAPELFARGAALADSDVALAPLDGDEALSAADALVLVGAVRAHDRAAIGRLLLSDPRGAAVVLEGTELRAGERVIDLTAPLEWRAFLFLESAGPLSAVVQATWVRQAGTEVVFVAPQADTRETLAPRAGAASRRSRTRPRRSSSGWRSSASSWRRSATPSTERPARLALLGPELRLSPRPRRRARRPHPA